MMCLIIHNVSFSNMAFIAKGAEFRFNSSLSLTHCGFDSFSILNFNMLNLNQNILAYKVN